MDCRQAGRRGGPGRKKNRGARGNHVTQGGGIYAFYNAFAQGGELFLALGRGFHYWAGRTGERCEGAVSG